jgi:hypothetical protein
MRRMPQFKDRIRQIWGWLSSLEMGSVSTNMPLKDMQGAQLRPLFFWY